MTLDAKIPSGPIEKKWDTHRFAMKLVTPANKRKYTLIVVGTGLAGASAAASLAELGYNVIPRCPITSLRAGPTASLHRRHQCPEELPERRRQRVSPVL